MHPPPDRSAVEAVAHLDSQAHQCFHSMTQFRPSGISDRLYPPVLQNPVAEPTMLGVRMLGTGEGAATSGISGLSQPARITASNSAAWLVAYKHAQS